MSVFSIFSKKTQEVTQVATTPAQLRDLIWAHKGQFFSVTFTKKNGEERTIVGQVGYKQGYDGENTVGHIEKYVTVVERGGTTSGDPANPGKPKFRNVDSESIKRLAIGGVVLYVKE